MYISKVEIKNIRGAGPEGLKVDFAKAAVKVRGTLAGWNVIAGPNGSGKTTLLQGIAASLVGPSGSSWLIRPDGLQSWIRQGADLGNTSTWVEGIPEDDAIPDPEIPLKPWRLSVDWTRELGGRIRPPRGDQSFILRYFWEAAAHGAVPDGWVLIGYGPRRATQRSSNDAMSVLKAAPRTSAVVTLFRDDAALERGFDWLNSLAMGQAQDGAKGTLLEGILRFLSDRLFGSHSPARLCMEQSGLCLIDEHGAAHPVATLGDGYRMLVSMVLDTLFQIDRFKPDHLLREILSWSTRDVDLQIKMSGVVIIDEPENHLHPALQQHLGFWLKRHFPNVQFIVCTHSALVCQAADRGGLMRMARPFEIEVLGQDAWEAVTNGTLDDAIVTKLFGISNPVAPEGQKLRKRLAEIESEMQRTPATPEKIAERRALLDQLPNAVSWEVAAALRGLEARK